MENFFKRKDSEIFKYEVQISDYETQYKSDEQVLNKMKLELAYKLIQSEAFDRICPIVITKEDRITTYKVQFKLTEI